MKKLWFIAVAVLLITACEKMKNPFDKNKKTKPCPTVSSESVPSSVKESFNHKYPNLSVEKWFDKGDNGYAAVFSNSNKKKIASFDNDGNFINEQTGDNQEGNNDNQDGENNDDHGCNCNISEDND